MPYIVKKYSNGWYVVKETTMQKMSKKPFKSEQAARRQMAAIGISTAARKKR